MKCTSFCLVSILVILVAIVSLAWAEEVQSSRENITNDLITKELITKNETGMTPREGKVLRAGGRSSREANALGENRSSQVVNREIGLEPRAKFDLSQRSGSVSKFEFNSDSITPLFSQNRYSRTKPTYQAPDNLPIREVYNLTGYPVIMLPNAIP